MNINNQKITEIIGLKDDISQAAKLYLGLGFRPVPISFKTSQPTVDLVDWFTGGITADSIDQHYSENPDDVVGLYLGDGLVVIQLCSEETIKTLSTIEQKHQAAPKMIIKTSEGESQYFRKQNDVFVNDALRCTGKVLPGISVKTGDEIVPVPPCDVVSFKSAWFDSADDLTEIDQSFIDDIASSNNAITQIPVIPCEDVQTTPEITEGQSICDSVPARTPSPLDAYGINTHFADVDTIPEAEAVLGDSIMRGEMTTVFADSGCGKTILVLHLLKNAINSGIIDPSYAGYINKDDSGHGLLEKVKFADKLGVQVIADVKGRSFNRSEFLDMLQKIIVSGSAPKSIVIVDTLKKLTNVNDKDDAVKFYNSVRPFTLAGGTVVFLAHNNKYRGGDGKGVYSGTSDNVQDVDATCLMDVVSEFTPENPERIVRIEGGKGRLSSANLSMFSYNAAEGLTWLERINTVREISQTEFEKIQFTHDRKHDEEIVTSLTATLFQDVKIPKMKLIKSVSEDTGFSRNAVMAVLDRYTGNNPSRHEWNFEVGGRGAKYYRLLDKEAVA